MKIVIDTTPLSSGHKTRGIGNYTRYLVKALSEIKTEHKVLLTSSANSLLDVDLIHYPYFDLFHSRLPFFKPARLEVVTIHDLIPLKLKQLFKLGWRSRANLWYQKWKARHMDAIIVDSESSKRDVIYYLGVPERKIWVVYLGVSGDFKPMSKEAIQKVRDKYKLPGTFVLYVGDINANKNLLALIQVVSEIKDLELVLVSQTMKNKRIKETRGIYALINSLGLTDRVRIVFNMPIDSITDLASVYSAATIYVQPSLYEGFGLPVLEAMACGTPVISSNRGSLPEVVGNAGLLVEPTVGDIKRGIVNLLNDKAKRERLSELGLSRSGEFTWKKCALRTLKVYKMATGGER